MSYCLPTCPGCLHCEPAAPRDAAESDGEPLYDLEDGFDPYAGCGESPEPIDALDEVG